MPRSAWRGEALSGAVVEDPTEVPLLPADPGSDGDPSPEAITSLAVSALVVVVPGGRVQPTAERASEPVTGDAVSFGDGIAWGSRRDEDPSSQ